MYRKILVPLDGSTRAEKIFPHVEEMAKCTGAGIVLVQIVSPAYYVMDPQVSYVDINQEETRYRIEEAEAYLAKQTAFLAAKGYKIETVVEQGPIVEGILDAAVKYDVDLIAMASHGRTGLARVFYGSVAAGVLQKVDRPLLLVRSRDDD